MNYSARIASFLTLLSAVTAHAQLAITVTTPKVVGQKAIVPLAMRNGFSEGIESARAAVFLSDEQGNVVGQATRWVIGGSQDKPGLRSKATNSFHFVVTTAKPLESTNLTARVVFNRLILEGGRSVDPRKSVVIQEK